MKNKQLLTYAAYGVGGYLLYKHLTTDKPKTTPTAFLDKWLQTVASGDAAKITSLYHDDAVLLPTVSPNIAVGKDEIRAYFDDFVTKSPSGEVNEIFTRIQKDIAIIDGNYTFSLTEIEKRRTNSSTS